jgi:hypothetical protein
MTFLGKKWPRKVLLRPALIEGRNGHSLHVLSTERGDTKWTLIQCDSLSWIPPPNFWWSNQHLFSALTENIEQLTKAREKIIESYLEWLGVKTGWLKLKIRGKKWQERITSSWIPQTRETHSHSDGCTRGQIREVQSDEGRSRRLSFACED